MPVFPTVSIPISFQFQNLAQVAQAQQALGGLAAAQQANLRLMAQGGRAGVGVGGGGTGQVAAGIGTFFILRQALSAVTGVMKTGVEDAANFEQALTRLQLITQANTTDLDKMKTASVSVSNALGPLAATDVLHNFEKLNQLVSITTPKMMEMIKPFSQFTSDISLLSAGKVGIEEAGELGKDIINYFGGAKDVKRSLAGLNEVYKAAKIYAPGDPGKLVTALRSEAPLGMALNFPPEQMTTLAAYITATPTGTRIGRDLAQLLMISAGGAGLFKGGKKSKAERIEAAEQLGLLDALGRPSAIDPKTGQGDIYRALFNMQKHVEALRVHFTAIGRPGEFQPALLHMLTLAVGSQLAQKDILLLTKKDNYDNLLKIAERIQEQTGIAKDAAKLQHNFWGAVKQLGTNVNNMLTFGFMPAIGALERISYGVATKLVGPVATTLSKEPIAQAGFLATVGGLGALTAFPVLGLIAKMFGGFLASAGGAGLGGGLGRVLVAAGEGLATNGAIIGAISAALGLAVLAGVAAYHFSPEFQKAVDATSTGFKQLLKNIYPLLPGSHGLAYPGGPKVPQAELDKRKQALGEKIPDSPGAMLFKDPALFWKTLKEKASGPIVPKDSPAAAVGAGLRQFFSHPIDTTIAMAEKADRFARNPPSITAIFSNLKNTVVGFFTDLFKDIQLITQQYLNNIQANIANVAMAIAQMPAMAIGGFVGPPAPPTPAPSKPAEHHGKSYDDIPQRPSRATKANTIMSRHAVEEWIHGVLSESMRSATEASTRGASQTGTPFPPRQY